MSTKKSKEELVDYYLGMLTEQAEESPKEGQKDTQKESPKGENVIEENAERILASLNSLADSDTGNPISIDGKIEILDLMKKRAQAQQQAQQQNTNGSLLAVIDSIKNRLETEFQEQYQRYYG